jgi:hypothetical protein
MIKSIVKVVLTGVLFGGIMAGGCFLIYRDMNKRLLECHTSKVELYFKCMSVLNDCANCQGDFSDKRCPQRRSY